MPVMSSSILSELEKLLVKTYKDLNDTQGDIRTPKSTFRNASPSKLMFRGGMDTVYGLSKDLGINQCTPSTVNDGSVYMTNGEYLGPRPSSAVTGAYVYSVSDTTLSVSYADSYDTAALHAVNVCSLSTKYEAINGACYNIKTVYIDPEDNATHVAYGPIFLGISGVDANAINEGPKPILPYGVVPLTECLLHYVYDSVMVCESPVVSDVREYGYYPATNDDTIFTTFTQVGEMYEGVQSTVDRTSELRPVVSALKAHTELRTGIDFYTYWESQGYSFTNEFRSLYAKYNLADIPQSVINYGGASLTPSTLTGTVMCPMNMKLWYVGPTTSAAATVSVYGVNGTTSFFIEGTPTIAPIENSIVYLNDKTPFVGSVTAAIKDNNSWLLIGPLTATSSAGVALAGSYGLYTPTMNYGHVDRMTGMPVHGSEIVYVGIPSGTVPSTVFVVGTTGTKYVGVASISIAGITPTVATNLLFKTY